MAQQTCSAKKKGKGVVNNTNKDNINTIPI